MRMITSNSSVASIAGMDNPRTTRRNRTHEETEFSNQSIMHAMEKFVRTVQEMDETILVPCRLLDLKVGDSTDQTTGKPPVVNGLLNHADLYALYAMIKAVKNDLMWGQQNTESQESDQALGNSYIPSSGATSLPVTTMPPPATNFVSLPAVKTHTRTGSASNIKPEKQNGHVRRPSTGSLVSAHSLASISLSDTDSEVGNENDSGIEEGSLVEPSVQIALSFRRHLTGLYKSLSQLTAAASYLTQRYQHDVGGTV